MLASKGDSGSDDDHLMMVQDGEAGWWWLKKPGWLAASRFMTTD